MQLKTKKRIAKEFLLFVGVMAVSLLIYGGTHLYNGVFYWKAQYHKSKLEAKQEKIKELASTYKGKETKQKWLFNQVKSELSTEPLTKIKVKRFMANGNKKDPQELTYQFLKKQGIKNFPNSKERWVNKLRQDKNARANTYEFLKNKDIKNFPESQDKWEQEIGLTKSENPFLDIDIKKNEPTSQPLGKAKRFYEYAKEKGFDVPDDFETFKSTLENRDKAKRFYDYAKSKDADVPNDFETFYDILNLGKEKKPTSPPKEQPHEINTYQELWQIFEDLAKKDTIVHKWNNKWSDRFKAILEEKGITNGEAFTSFIKTNTLTEQDRQNKKLVEKLKNERWELKTTIQEDEIAQLDSKEQWNFLVYPFYGLLILAYPVRFFVLALRWSILTLRKE